MRLKKLMSLVLACAMALSLVTVASAADTEVYYIEDFDSYPDNTAFFAGMTTPETWATSGGHPSNASIVSALSVVATNGTGIYGILCHNGSVSSTSSTLSNGKFSLHGNDSDTDATGMLVIATKNTWDYLTKGEDYTYVISYDRSWTNNRITAAATNYGGTGGGLLIWTDAERTTAGTGPVFYATQSYTDSVAGMAYGASSPADPNSGRVSLGTVTWGEEYKYAVGIKKGAASGDYYIAATSFARDGVATDVSANTRFNKLLTANQTMTHLGGFYFHDSYKLNSTLDNIRMYTIKDGSFKATSTASEGKVDVKNKAITVNLGNIVAADTFDKNAVVVKKDGVAMDGGYTVDLDDVIGNVGGEIYSTATVTFDALEEDTEYSIVFADTVANEIGTTLGENNTVTFKTKAPDVKVTNYTLVNAADGLKANNTVQGVKFELLNTTAESRNVALIYAVYTTAGQLTDVMYVNEAIAAEGTATVEAAAKLTAAGTLKAFVWDSLDTIRPYSYKDASGFKITAVAAAE